MVYDVYTTKEADEKGIKYKYWKEASKDEYGATDDGYVSICLDRRDYTDAKGFTKAEIIFPTGRNWVTAYSKIEFETNKAFNSFHCASPKGWQESEARKARTQRVIKAYVKQMIGGHIDYDQLGKIYRADQKNPAATFRRLLKEKRIQKMVDKELDEVFVKFGINKEFAIKLIMEAIAAARASGKSQDLLKCSQELQGMLGMSGNRVIRTDTIEASRKTLNLIEEESAKSEKMKLQQRIEYTEYEELEGADASN